MTKIKELLFGICLFAIIAGYGCAEPYSRIMKMYPSADFFIGIGEVNFSGDLYQDRRRAEMMARLEIAKQIRVSIKSVTVDKICEGGDKIIYNGESECKNQFSMIVEEAVNKVLEGSMIVDHGKDGGKVIYYAIAVLQRANSSSSANVALIKTIDKIKAYLKKAKLSGNEGLKGKYLKKAKEELLKGLAVKELASKELKEKAKDAFKKLVLEIKDIEDNWQE